MPLSPKTYDTLLFLVENRGRLLSKNELMQALWPDSFVEEANLTQQISNIRKALGESAGRNGCIVTVPGRGYRFAGEVTEWTESPDDETDLTPAPAEQTAQEASAGTDIAAQRRRRLALFAAALAVVLTGLLGYKAYRRQPGAEALKPPRSLAILPFHNLVDDPQSEYLGFSLVDAIITKLGYVSSLAVRPSYAVARYRNQIVDIPKIAAELSVNTLLTFAKAGTCESPRNWSTCRRREFSGHRHLT